VFLAYTRFQFIDGLDCAAWHDNFRGGFRVRPSRRRDNTIEGAPQLDCLRVRRGGNFFARPDHAAAQALLSKYRADASSLSHGSHLMAGTMLIRYAG